jgi:histidinol-phosphatase
VRGVPLFGTLLAIEHDGELQVGVMSAPALGERWYATRGGGAWAVRGGGAEAPRRIRVSGVSAIDDAHLLHGSAFDIEASGRAPGFQALRGAVWRERGFGDFWGYALLAEGAAEAMIEIGVGTWDIAAPLVIVEEAGGRLTDLDGNRRIDGREALATNGLLHDEFVRRVRGGAPE